MSANIASGAVLPDSADEKPTITKTAVAAAIAGNALEFYDFVIYAFFAVYIGKAFFPVGNEAASLLASVAVYGVGFLTRPLGGVVIGAFADKAGRKPAMILTVALITVGTLGLAATPSYASIGMAAPIIILICRLLQGLAIGGEVGPSTSLLVEGAPSGKRGLYASWQIASQGIAVLVGGLCGVLVSANLTEAQLADWGWRVPFLVSLILIPIAVYMRRKLPETHEDESGKSGAEIVATVVSGYRRYLILGILLLLAGAVSAQVGNYMTTYAIHTLKLPATLAQTGTLVGGLITFIAALAAGYLSDHYGRKALMIWPRVVLTVLVIPLFMLLHASPNAATLLFVTGTTALLAAMSGAASLVAIPELMPTAFRSTGTSLIYAIGVTLFGGTTQFIITWLLGVAGPLAPAWYMVVTSLITLWAMWMIPETRDVDVTK
ncbi:MFS transporter [Bradyrhizobium sp. B120]|uniref:MFS transporter n=1 Tax=Bradyrhizobium sp. B120 TaxID=3410088 RepID=UPI003B98611C